MKIRHKTEPQFENNRRPLPALACAAAMLAMLGGTSQASAASYVKADNNDALNTAAAWANGTIVPGPSDIAVWDNTIVNNTTNALGGSLTWGGIQISSLTTWPVQIGVLPTTGTLTLGSSGIDMSAAQQSLTISNAVAIPDYTVESWNVVGGQTLSLEGAFTRTGGSCLTMNNSGTINIAGGTASTSLYYALVNNGTDIGALNSSKQVSTVSTVFGYTGNVLHGVPSTGYCDMVNGNTSTTDDSYLNTTIFYPSIIRFNIPQPNRNYWSFNAYKGQISLNAGATTFLVTTNVGACDVFFGASGSGGITVGWRQSTTGSELIVDQENTEGSTYFNGSFSQKSALASNMLTKRGAGRSVFNIALQHTGPTRILEGEMMINSTTIPASVTTVSSGATLSGIGNVEGSATNSGTIWAGTNGLGSLTVGTLTMNAGSALKFYSPAVATTNTTGLLVITNTLTVNGAVSVAILSGHPALGQYPLIKSTSAIVGTFNLATMPIHTLGYLSNNAAAFSIDLVITNITEPLSWASSLSSDTWNTNYSSIWKDTLGTPSAYQEINGIGDSVLFADALSAASPLTVNVPNTLVPASTTVNATKTYTISGSGSIAGTGSLTKTNTGTLYLQTANSFSGGIYLGGGILNFNALTNLGGGGINFTGGTLQYASGNADDISVRTVWFGGNTGTIDDGGNTITFANPIGNSGPGSFAKIGSGTLTLNGTNKYTGSTIVGAGTLALGSATTYISNSVSIVVYNGAILDVSAKPALTLNGSIGQTLSGSGTVNGSVINGTGATISPGDGTINTLTVGPLTLSGGTNLLDVSTVSGQSDLINATDLTLTSGTMHLVAANALTVGTYKLISYSGTLLSGAGSSGNLVVLVTGAAQSGKSLTLSDATSGEIDLIVAVTASDTLTWTGTAGAIWGTSGSLNWLNGATPWAFTNGDLVTFDGTGIANPAVSLQASVQPSSVTVSNDVGTTYTFNDGTGVGGGKIIGSTAIVKKGAGTLVIATANINTGATLISNGIVQIGAGGATGDLGSGNVTDNSVLAFNQTGTHTVSGSISGTGSVVQQGSATVILAANNTYAGPTTIASGGTLQIGTGGANGSLGAGAITNDGTLVYNHTGTFSVGNIKAGPANGGALTFQGNASVTLNDGNTYINNTAVQGGVVQLAAADSIPSAATVAGSTGWLVLDGGASSAGVLDVNGLNITVNALSGLGNTVNGVITNTSATVTTNMLTVLNGGTTYNGAILGSATGAKLGLTLLGTTELRLNGNCAYAGPTYVGSGATLGVGPGYVTPLGPTILSNNAAFNMHANGSTAVFPGNEITIPDNSAATLNSTAAGNGFGGTVAGGVTATNIIGPNISAGTAAVEQWGAFYGTVWVTNGGTIRFSSTSLSLNGGENATFQVDGSISSRNGSTATGAGIYLGALTGSGGLYGGGTATASVTTFNIGGKGIDSIFSGTIADGGAPGPVAIVKNGAGTLTLNGGTTLSVYLDDNYNLVTNYIYTNFVSYSGATTISNGVLALVAPVLITNSSVITLASATAILDGSKMGYPDTTQTNLVTNGVFEVVSGKTLAGIGTIRATSVVLDAGSIFNVGLPLGGLTATNTVELGGLINMNVSATNSPNASTLSAKSFIVDGTASLVVTNKGPENYGVFQLFSHPVSIPSVTLPTLTGTNTWVNNLAVNGSITLLAPALVPTVNTNSTNITTSVSGGNLTLTWPSDHTGWRLQTQTNALTAGLGTNWVDVAGATTTNQVVIPISSSNGSVFFRMIYP